MMFPLLYIPVINDYVFKHTGISWEWAIVFIEAFLWFCGAEVCPFFYLAPFSFSNSNGFTDVFSINSSTSGSSVSSSTARP